MHIYDILEQLSTCLEAIFYSPKDRKKVREAGVCSPKYTFINPKTYSGQKWWLFSTTMKVKMAYLSQFDLHDIGNKRVYSWSASIILYFEIR